MKWRLITPILVFAMVLFSPSAISWAREHDRDRHEEHEEHEEHEHHHWVPYGQYNWDNYYNGGIYGPGGWSFQYHSEPNYDDYGNYYTTPWYDQGEWRADQDWDQD